LRRWNSKPSILNESVNIQGHRQANPPDGGFRTFPRDAAGPDKGKTGQISALLLTGPNPDGPAKRSSRSVNTALTPLASSFSDAATELTV
jgi:hypothetical protein